MDDRCGTNNTEDREGSEDRVDSCNYNSVEEEENEIFVVICSYTVAYPRTLKKDEERERHELCVNVCWMQTVVIHAEHTATAHSAVMRSEGSHLVAEGAVCDVGLFRGMPTAELFLQ